MIDAIIWFLLGADVALLIIALIGIYDNIVFALSLKGGNDYE